MLFWGCTVLRERQSTLHQVRKAVFSRRTLGWAARDGESPVDDRDGPWVEYVSTTGHEKSGGKLGRPRSKAKKPQRPIADSTVRER